LSVSLYTSRVITQAEYPDNFKMGKDLFVTSCRGLAGIKLTQPFSLLCSGGIVM